MMDMGPASPRLTAAVDNPYVKAIRTMVTVIGVPVAGWLASQAWGEFKDLRTQMSAFIIQQSAASASTAAKLEDEQRQLDDHRTRIERLEVRIDGKADRATVTVPPQ